MWTLLPTDQICVWALLRRQAAQTTQGKMDELKQPVSAPLSPTGSSRSWAKNRPLQMARLNSDSQMTNNAEQAKLQHGKQDLALTFQDLFYQSTN